MESGFTSVAYFGAYDAAVDIGGTDRLVAVAQRPTAAASRLQPSAAGAMMSPCG
jgi:hypothetical protein